ncbi:LytTR family DNA-binding domain-containing protein [Paenibacillus sp. N1-5-1-14]|uniref:LytR/AlgR family response regulator transcription factor n=1 Tax=Paenibacillus radicibacter TaxID=2972488 RepID=UPI002158B543|nr:LytTR family DNA-binding domain-containing protein [Paenibacillus radicibacter]MCR8641059.1 LytTR family DNA-binding domain-containing protein [Paenibacillus radicibacter]
MRLNIVIADDEAPAREELAYMLSQYEQVDKLTQAINGLDTIKKVKEQKPDILFLDMNMPDLNGLQVAEIIREWNPNLKIVFSTAYDQYAIPAFKLRAFHYMLKPYDEEDVEMIFRELGKIQVNTGASTTPPPQQIVTRSSVKLALELEEGIKYVSPIDVVYISKEGKHVQVHLRENAYTVSYNLCDLEDKLEQFGFFRCHKSYLVNLDKVAELKSWVNGAYNLMMNDARKNVIPVSRNYIKSLRLKLEI